MKNTVSLTLYALFIVCLACLNACKPTHDFTYSDDTTGNFADFQGKWVLINYWAEWCKPCAKEIPELNALSATNKITVIGINFDEMSIVQQADTIATLKIQFPVIYSVSKTAFDKHYGFPYPQALPTSVLINPEGKVEKIFYGPQTLASITAAIKS